MHSSSPAVRSAEHAVEVVEGALHRVDREVAGEHAPVRSERLDGELDPRGEGIDASCSRAAWPGRRACTRRCRRGRPVPSGRPSRGHRSSSESERGHPVCSTTTVRPATPSSCRAAASSWSEWAISSKTKLRSSRARSTSGVGDGRLVRAHGPDARGSGTPSSAVSRRAIGLSCRVGGREATDDGVGPTDRVGAGIRARWSRRPSGVPWLRRR